jgi:ribosomal protein S18 acetylase RimI-like enzyme
MHIRPALRSDADAVWAILEPTIRAGETYTLPADMIREDALAFWTSPDHEVFVVEENEIVVGTYFLRANHRGGGSHVCNCGYVTAPHASGRGIARTMCTHSLERARERGFLAMQFNFVISSNERAVRLWESFGFNTVGRLPQAFRHPTRGLVDSLVMHRFL